MRVVPMLGLLLLGIAAFEVYWVRDRILDAELPPDSLAALKERLGALPATLGDGEYRPDVYEIDPEVVERSGADAYVARGYRDSSGSVYRVYIGGAIRNRESFHAPNYCLPGAGWDVEDQRRVASPMGGEDASMSRLVVKQGQAQMVVYYWFQCGRRQTAFDLVARWYRFLDFVASSFGLVDGEKIPPTMIASIYVPFRGTMEEADQRARRFMEAVRPALMDAVKPDGK